MRRGLRLLLPAAVAAVLGATPLGGCAAISDGTTPGRVPGDLPGWKRVLADGFDGSALNTSIWGAYSGQPGGDPGGWWEPSHAVVRNGVLRLETYRDRPKGDRRKGRRWVSGGVSSAHGLEQRYGKYAVRFRMDAGHGVAGILLLWPQHGWPPEIDFAEMGGITPGRPGVTATLHYGRRDRTIARSVRADFTTWHVAGVEWNPGQIVYTLDGRRWATVRSRHVPKQNMELDIQAQAGTCGHRWAPCPNAKTPAKVDLQVDWVVAYRRVVSRWTGVRTFRGR
jgi:beta-glucanase (GH16 family)